MNGTNKNVKREEWVDVLRGMAVFLVLLGHLYTGYVYHLAINPIKMPMFYFLAGYVTKFNRSLIQVFASRARTLFVPMLVFSLFPIRALYYVVILNNMDLFLNYIKGFATGTINWFIYSFFVSSILFAVIGKITKGNKIVFGLICVCMFFVGIITKDISVMDIWCINTAFTGLLFMFIGHVVKGIHSKFLDNTLIATICFVCYGLFLWLSATLFRGETINYHLCEYYNIPICVALIITGIYVSRYIAKRACDKTKNKAKNFFVSFGQNTIVVYLASSTFNAVVLYGIQRFLHTSEPSFIMSMFGAALSSLLGYVVSILCRKYAPFLLGIKRQH